MAVMCCLCMTGVVFSSCNPNKEETPEQPAAAFDGSKLLGAWKVSTYSCVRTNLDADTIILKDERANAGSISIRKVGDEYLYTENFISDDSYEGKMEVGDGVVSLNDSEGFMRTNFSYDLKVSDLTDKSMKWSYSATGTTKSMLIINGEKKEVSYKVKEEVNITLTK